MIILSIYLISKIKSLLFVQTFNLTKTTDYIKNIREQEKEPEQIEKEFEKLITRERGLNKVQEKGKVESIGMEITFCTFAMGGLFSITANSENRTSF